MTIALHIVARVIVQYTKQAKFNKLQ